MIGHDSIKRNNFFYQRELKRWLKNDWINSDEFDLMQSKCVPSYSSTNIFVWAGMFFLTAIIINAGSGLMGLVFAGLLDGFLAPYLSLLLAMLICFGLQRIVISDKNQFRSGIDEATLYAGMLYAFAGFYFILEQLLFSSPLLSSIFLTIFFAIPAFIYFDRILIVLATSSFYTAVFLLVLEIGSWVQLAMPFVFMLLSIFLFKFSNSNRENASHHASDELLKIIGWIAIIMFYVSGNYFVVDSLNGLLNEGVALPVGLTIAFYTFTILTPIIYITWGLNKKRLDFLNIGLATVVVSVASLYSYHQQIPIEWLLVSAGLILIIIAWSAMQYWKVDKHHITMTPDDTLNKMLQLESLIVMETAQEVTSSTTDTIGQGGEFGGGGASGDF